MFPASRTRPSSKVNGVGVQVEDTRICVVMVGLPARGKSLIAQKGKCQSPSAYACRNMSH
jgi:6-phosphofructo-2-kinase/fructose-2,6-biphosphatase 2